MTLSTHLRRNLLRFTILLVVAAVGWAGWQAFRVWRAWQNLDRITFDTAQAREALGQQGTIAIDGGLIDPETGEDAEVPGTLPPDVTLPTSPHLAPESLQAFLIIGSDYRPQLGTASRADVIVLVLLPADGSDPVMVSIPRDLYLPNPCTGGYTRIMRMGPRKGDAAEIAILVYQSLNATGTFTSWEVIVAIALAMISFTGRLSSRATITFC